jgi:hypothetical protein
MYEDINVLLIPNSSADCRGMGSKIPALGLR